MQRDQFIHIRLTLEEKERMAAQAEKEGFGDLSSWGRVTLLRELGEERKTLTKKEARPRKSFEDRVLEMDPKDVGSFCPGSGMEVEFFEFPQNSTQFGNCSLCGKGMRGVKQASGLLKLREHLDGVEEIGAVENYGAVVEEGSMAEKVRQEEESGEGISG